MTKTNNHMVYLEQTLLIYTIISYHDVNTVVFFLVILDKVLKGTLE